MAKYKPQHARLLFIDREINTGRYPNCGKLAKDYEVSNKTIQRDLDYMRYQLDAPIEYSAQHRGYYYTEPNYKLPAITSRKAICSPSTWPTSSSSSMKELPIYDSLCSVFKKIEDSCRTKISLDLGNEQSRFTVFPPSNTIIKPGIWETVTGAIRLSRRIEVRYQTPGSEPSIRDLDPYHGVRFEGDWYVVAYCHLRKEIRTFSLARMISAKMLQDSFRIPAGFDFHNFPGSHFGVHWSDDEFR